VRLEQPRFAAMDPIIVPVVGAGVACGVIGGAQAIESFGFRDVRSNYDRSGRPTTPRYKMDLSGRVFDDHKWDNMPGRGPGEQRSDRYVLRDGVWHYNDENEEEFRYEMLEREGFRRPHPRRGTTPRSPPRLGLKISQQSPYLVEQVFTLMDPHGWKQWERGYSNPEVRQGDMLLAVDGAPIDGLHLPEVNAKLGGLPYTVRTLTLRRTNASDKNIDQFEVTLVRHVDSKRPPWTRPRDASVGQGAAPPPARPYDDRERRAHDRNLERQHMYDAQPRSHQAHAVNSGQVTYTSDLYMTTSASTRYT